MHKRVLLGDPSSFWIKSGINPHTRDALGLRKKVDQPKALAQWQTLKGMLESHGVKVSVLPPVKEEPGLVFPANAGFLHGERFFLSNLNPARAGEKAYYARTLSDLGFYMEELPSPHPFEGEADFIEAGGLFLFTYGRIERQRWVPRPAFPPYRRVYGFRSDRRILSTLQSIVGKTEILPLELVDEFHYHGDTVLCPFGPNREYLLAFLPGLSANSQGLLRSRFGERFLPLSDADGRAFAANSFQVSVEHYGQMRHILFMPDGLTDRLYTQIRARGVIPCPVDVSEFLEKGGGAVKCLLLDLSPEGVL